MIIIRFIFVLCDFVIKIACKVTICHQNEQIMHPYFYVFYANIPQCNV